MGVLEAILIGIIQGLTEFLPVSSSGHIELSKAILKTTIEGEDNVMFTVVLHAATALSTIVVFRKEILQIFKGLFQFTWNDEFRFSVKIIISMFPAAIVGIVFKEEIDDFFTGEIMLVGLMLLITGAVLFLADKANETPTPNILNVPGCKIPFNFLPFAPAILIAISDQKWVFPPSITSQSFSPIASWTSNESCRG